MEQPGPPASPRPLPAARPTSADTLAARARSLAAQPGSLLLVALEAALFAWVVLGAGHPPSTEALLRAGALERGHVWRGEWWRLGSAVLLHGSWLHFALNALFGLGWCRLVERTLGTARFLLLFAVSGLAASATSLLLQDVVSVGASGALFGMIGTTLVLHRRALPGWRAFLGSRATISVALQLAGFTAVAVALSLHFDHAAHAGGLVAGAACAWLLTGPRPRRLAWAALAAALLALGAAAAWPRPGASGWEAAELERAVFRALRAEDRAAAGAQLRRAAERGVRSDALAYAGGLLAAQEGRLEEAVNRLRPVARQGQPAAAREEARRVLAGVTRELGYRRYTGDGAPLDPEAGLLWFEESCAAGEPASCRDVDRLRGRLPP